ncbi:exonuclease domain-containing protein [Microbacterium sp. STN6]|uniref:exonuclease domain-containing protein n=1 Tax=Microbacterium sp. STN6 TaxID=2995588 RepID=UPI002260DDFA|nr:exonuclease domain-containing protein [Microbacterium sp. STN6]MCX7521598.1 exonuclease domain-containing protein [Microbacterium sp. STN6]
MAGWHDELSVFDLETTGVDVETARIVSAHVGVLDTDGAIVERLDWIVDPGVEIPEAATAVHGITTARARAEGREAREAVSEIVAALRTLLNRGLPIVAYNAPYDLTLLNREATRYGITPLATPAPVIDPLVIDRAVDKYRRGKRTLEVTCGHYGVSLVGAHDAGADAVAAGRVAQAIARAYPAELGIDAAELHRLQVRWCLEQAADFQEYMRRVKDPQFTTSGLWPER